MKYLARLFFDMDGTLARFYESADCLEKMWQKGFFENLKPYKNMVETYKKAIQLKNSKLPTETMILSAVNIETAETVIKEKEKWIEKYLCKNNSNLFLKITSNKAEQVSKNYGKIDKSFILIDDYNKNLRDWREAGGTAIKFVNEINDKGTNGPLWNGFRIRYDYSPERMFKEITDIIKNVI